MHIHHLHAVEATPGRAVRRQRVVQATLACAVGFAGIVTAAAASGQPREGRPPRGTLSAWVPCTDAAGVQCATLTVPLDWSRPRGPTIALDAVRRPADDPSQRVGALFYNPGGPGDTPNDFIKQAGIVFSDTVRHRFDLVGLDPRGVGESTRVRCDVAPYTATGTLFPQTEAQFNELRTHNRAVGLSCLASAGALLSHTDTVSVARDNEALRAAIGENKITWLGISYGTQVAANYAEMFGRHTRGMVLDAALEHSEPELQQVTDEMMTAEESFDRFATWCTTTVACALHGTDVGVAFDQLVIAADQHPIEVPGALHPVRGEDIRMFTKGMLRLKEPSIFGPDNSWAGLSQVLAAALDGDASPIAIPADAPQESATSLLAIACMDYVPQVHTWKQMQQRLELGRQLAPHLQGASESWQINYCIDWPLPAANPPRTLHVTGVPALMVHAAHDASDPYRWAHSLGAQIDGSAVLTRAGDGHTSYSTSPCARAATDAYLVTLEAAPNSVCAD